MCFGKYVGSLISRRNKEKTNSTTNHMLPYEMTINLYVFGTIVEDIIMSNLNGTLIVTM